MIKIENKNPPKRRCVHCQHYPKNGKFIPYAKISDETKLPHLKCAGRSYNVENRQGANPKWAEECPGFILRTKETCLICANSKRNTKDGSSCEAKGCHTNGFPAFRPLYLSGRILPFESTHYKAVPKVSRVSKPTRDAYGKLPGRIDPSYIRFASESGACRDDKVSEKVSVKFPTGNTISAVKDPDALVEIRKRISAEKTRRNNKAKLLDDKSFEIDYLDAVLEKKDRKTVKKLERIGSSYMFSGNWIYELDKNDWDIVSDLIDKLITGKEKYQQLKIVKAKEELCRLTDCYKEKDGEIVRKKVALKICESCGKENLIEASFCSECRNKF